MKSTGNALKLSFFSSVAHELRTPLNTVKPITYLLMQTLPRQTPEYDKFQQYLRIVYNSSIHLENVIEDALDISRLENGKFTLNLQEEELSTILREVQEVMQFQVEQKRLSLVLMIGNQVPESVVTDKKRLKQVLFNLIGNALKFTIEGSVTVVVRETGERLSFEIIDTGIGIS